jgi:hypothetical protein
MMTNKIQFVQGLVIAGKGLTTKYELPIIGST